MGEYLLSLPYYKSNSWLHAAHFACSAPTWPIMKIRPTVWHFGQCPVVTFFGPLLIIFWVFRRPITQRVLESSIKFKHQTLKQIRIVLVSGNNSSSKHPTPIQIRQTTVLVCVIINDLTVLDLLQTNKTTAFFPSTVWAFLCRFTVFTFWWKTITICAFYLNHNSLFVPIKSQVFPSSALA